jgi:hypothetical protein
MLDSDMKQLEQIKQEGSKGQNWSQRKELQKDINELKELLK